MKSVSLLYAYKQQTELSAQVRVQSREYSACATKGIHPTHDPSSMSRRQTRQKARNASQAPIKVAEIEEESQVPLQ